MATQSSFREVIDFLEVVGVMDVILPFLLVFTIMFAILEKTKVLGVDKIKDVSYSKKNLNATVAFITGFLVVASVQLVNIINEVMANVVLLVLLGISFLMLVGVFYGSEEFTLKDHQGWLKWMIIIMFIGISVIFLNALGWLDAIWTFFSSADTSAVGGVIFVLIILGFIVYVTSDPNKPEKGNDGDND
jgi:hypothetical protein